MKLINKLPPFYEDCPKTNTIQDGLSSEINNLYSKVNSTINQLYVALTRTKGNLYIIKNSDYRGRCFE